MEIEKFENSAKFKKMLATFMKRGTLYHCTKRKHLDKILKEGLKPNKPEGITNAINGVHLSVVPFDWMDYTTEQGRHAGLMIEVDIKGLELIFDNGILDVETWQSHPAFVYPDIITRERFVKIFVSTEKKPNIFNDITKKCIQNKRQN